MRARIRTIKPEFWDSERVADVSLNARLTFIGLWTLSDDVGRLRCSARYVKKMLYGYDDDDVMPIERLHAVLEELHEGGLIKLYDVDGQTYAEITGWSEHQRIDKPRASKIPEPSGKRRETSRLIAKRRYGPGPGPPTGPPTVSGKGSFLSEPTPGSSTKQIKAPTAAEVSAEAESLRAQIPVTLRTHVETMIGLMAAENKTQQVSESRVVREILRPAAEWLSDSKTSIDDARAGLEKAVQNGICHIGYAKKVSKSPRRTGPKKAAPETSYEGILKALHGGSNDV